MSARDIIGQAIDAFPGKLHSEKIDLILSALRDAGWSVVKVPDAKCGDDDLSAYSQGREAGWNACRAATLATEDRDDHG